jgi:hypothetical protein
MKTPACWEKMKKFRDYCPECKIEKHAAHHYFNGLGFCQHYQITCRVKGIRGMGGNYHVPIPGTCGPNKSAEPPPVQFPSE